MAFDIHWDVQALAFLEGISVQFLDQGAQEVADRARMLAPVRTGHLKGSVYHSLGSDALGPYADVASLWYGRFMDPKARQLHRLRPFLPSALDVLNGRVFT